MTDGSKSTTPAGAATPGRRGCLFFSDDEKTRGN
jgi:hypothetical protein